MCGISAIIGGISAAVSVGSKVFGGGSSSGSTGSSSGGFTPGQAALQELGGEVQSSMSGNATNDNNVKSSDQVAQIPIAGMNNSNDPTGINSKWAQQAYNYSQFSDKAAA